VLELSIKYDGIEIPSFITITNIKTQVLPSIENKLLQAPRAMGAIDVGTNYGTKIITISIMFKDKSLGFIEKSEALASWLRVDDLKARKLVLPSHPNSYYLAKPNNSIELDDNITMAKGEIEFVCLNPFRIDEVQTLQDSNNFNYNGTAKTCPILDITATGATNNIEINISNELYNNYINLVGDFKVGDKVMIDLGKSKVYLNNELNMGIWGLDSKYHKICRGINTYSISNGDLIIRYHNQYL
jgi:predicted phage tail component-like protein